MAHHVLYALSVHTGGHSYCGCGMPKVVGPCVRPPDAGGDALKIFIKRVDGIMPPKPVGENQIIRVIPQSPCRQTIGDLL